MIDNNNFIEGTELLTPYGWKNISSILIGDWVVQYNKNRTLEYVRVLNSIKKDYSGIMYEFSRKGQKCVVTPEHNMFIYYKKSGYKKITAENLKIHDGVCIPIAAPLVNGLIKSTINDLSFEDRLRIAIQADGTNKWYYWRKDKTSKTIEKGYTHIIGIKKVRKIERLDWILNNVLNLYYKKSNPDKNEVITYRIVYNHDFNYKDFKWIDLTNKSSIWCKEFIKELSEWDGFKSGKGTLHYSTTHKENLNVIQAIAVLAGYSTTISPKVDIRSETFSDSWRISFKESNSLPTSCAVSKNKLYYNGNIFSILVPSGGIITRYQDKTFIASNCLI